MGQSDDNNDVYHNLTESIEPKKSTGNQGWTLYLILCCLTVCASSFIFGYNIGSTNLPTPLIKEFYARKYYPEYYAGRNSYDEKHEAYNAHLKVFHAQLEKHQWAKNTSNFTVLKELGDAKVEIEKKLNMSADQFLNETKASLDVAAEKLRMGKENLDSFNTLMWTITTSLFVVGGAIGAFGSKYILEFLGRKKGILFNYIFSISGAILTLIAPYVNSPECVIASRFLFGLHGGATCGLIPTYLAEISPSALRGATGVVHQLFLTIGILVAQTLGFRQILGTADCWHFLLAIPLIPSVLGGVSLLLFFPESPKALLLNNKDEESARKALHRLRNSTNVTDEIDEMKYESSKNKSDEAVSLKELFTLKELRWPLITGLVLQLAQQLCGINAIFFYSEGIFRRATIQPEHIQYAVFATGLINVLCTILVVPLIDKLGRKPLLVYPMCVMILDFIILTVCLVLQKNSIIYSYLSIICIVIFIMCFAAGLGPIPFVYVAECFRQDARGAAIAICMFTNWAANLLLTLTFEYLAALLKNYVFLIFTVIVAFAVLVIFKKVPETKGRSPEEIMAHFEGRKPQYDESSEKLRPNTKV